MQVRNHKYTRNVPDPECIKSVTRYDLSAPGIEDGEGLVRLYLDGDQYFLLAQVNDKKTFKNDISPEEMIDSLLQQNGLRPMDKLSCVAVKEFSKDYLSANWHSHGCRFCAEINSELFLEYYQQIMRYSIQSLDFEFEYRNLPYESERPLFMVFHTRKSKIDLPGPLSLPEMYRIFYSQDTAPERVELTLLVDNFGHCYIAEMTPKGYSGKFHHLRPEDFVISYNGLDYRDTLQNCVPYWCGYCNHDAIGLKEKAARLNS